MKLDLYTQKGDKKGTVTVSDSMFKIEPNEELMRLAVVRYMANVRSANAHTKTRGEVRGGGKKPWRQKGTGRARFGSSRNPIWIGGGVAFGPRNDRNYTKMMNKKARRKALFSALSIKTKNDGVFVLDNFEMDKPQTRYFVALLSKLPECRSLLIVLPERNFPLEKSVSNISNVKTVPVEYINTYDILKYDKILFLEASIKKAEELFL